MDRFSPLLAMFCFLNMPQYAQHLTLDNIISALGFAVFLLNELRRFAQHVAAYLAGRKERRKARPKPLKAFARTMAG